MTIDLTGRVAIITGAGGGLGREHALLLARRGAFCVVNDPGGARSGDGMSSAADDVVAEIRASGGAAIADKTDVTDNDAVLKMVQNTVSEQGRLDIVVNNAGILRDRTFAKVDLADFRAVLDVHLMGAVHVTKAAWPVMQAQRYGRVVMTTSSSGLFGNFGQSAYAAAKMALVGLMNALHLEGAKYDIRVNCLSPSAATRMTEDVLTPEVLELLSPAAVSPAVLALVGEDAPSRTILCAGAGSFERAHVTLTRGLFLGASDQVAETILARLDKISDRSDSLVPEAGPEQAQYEYQLMHAAQARETEGA